MKNMFIGFILLMVVLLSGCATFNAIKTVMQNPLFTQAIIEELLQNNPSWAEEAVAVAKALQGANITSLDTLEAKAVAKVVDLDLTPSQEMLALQFIDAIKVGLASDFERLAVTEEVERLNMALSFVDWLANVQ